MSANWRATGHLVHIMQFKCLHKIHIMQRRVCVCVHVREILPVINKRGRIMNNKIQYDLIIIIFNCFNVREKKDRKERKKYLFCESMSAFILVFFFNQNKVLTAVTHTVNYLVYAINNEV